MFQRGVNFQEWRARTTTLTDLIAVREAIPTLVATDDGTKRLWGARISANAFAALGVNAMLGRTLQPSDDRDPNVVVLGFEAWRRLFRSDPHVVGRHLELRGNVPQPPLDDSRRVASRVRISHRTDGLLPTVRSIARRSGQAPLIGRLRDGVSLSAAMDEAHVIGTAIRPPRPANARPLPVPRFEVQRLKR